MYRIAVKPSAAADNPAAAAVVRERGRILEFASRTEAEGFAGELSERGGRLRVQAAAPQEPADVDGYLIRFPASATHEPKAVGPGGFTFDIEANLYGALGRALVFGEYGVSPGVRYALLERFPALADDTHRLRAVPEPPLPDDVPAAVSWRPDCRLEARRGSTVERAFYVEIKAGAASFQRGQLDDMRTVARGHDVLKLRVDVADLPAEYTVRLEPVEPA